MTSTISAASTAAHDGPAPLVGASAKRLALTAYRPEIDGLRAIAVLSVLAFHAFPKWIRGGFVGVDIFFVISGFLISGIIYRELDESGRFSFAHFYARRIKRIFPALIVVLIVTLLLGQQFLFADELADLSKNVVASAFFASNLFLIGHSGYFDGASDLNPLLHLWSLGIEEQFYIVWPVILVLCWRRHAMWWWLVVLVAISFGLDLALVDRFPVQTFYLPFTRFWELWAGASLAYGAHRAARPGERRHDARWTLVARLLPAIPYVGIAILAVAVLLYRGSDPFPGWRAALPVLGTVLLIAAPRDNPVNHFVLTNPVALFFGRISYPLYVWHWPLLAFLRIQYEHTEIPARYRVLALALSAVLAWLTYRWIERPIRFGIGTSRKPVLLALAMATVAVVGVLQWRYQESRHDEDSDFARFFKNYPKTHNLSVAYGFECGFIDAKGQPRGAIDASCVTPGARRSVMLWGDSHAQALRYGLARNLPMDTALLQVATFGCHPAIVTGPSSSGSPCQRSNAFALETVKRLKPAVVVLAQQSNHEATDWTAFAQVLRAQGVERVVVVGPSPEWTPNLYRVLVKDFRPPHPVRLKSHLVAGITATDRLMKERYAGNRSLNYTSIVGLLCDRDGCLTMLSQNDVEKLTTFDYGHLTLSASEYVGHALLRPLLDPNLDGHTSQSSRP